ncbi:hypothetical protein [Actinomadura sp. WMMB 499]|uniref:hypothetical protein n=1 Tax=Actinomadura sp. WMMB 499 TaxID=1219491 RepID=UPI00159D7359|nr:hypothetical protein [Actinomadura sp. WMMB 499]
MRRSRLLSLDALPRRPPVRILRTSGTAPLERPVPVPVAGTAVPLELPGAPFVARASPVAILEPPLALAAGTRAPGVAALTGPPAELAVTPGAALLPARPTLTIVSLEPSRTPFARARTTVFRPLVRTIRPAIVPIP